MDTILSEIEKAIASKSAIQVKYNGGSHPGTMREITPTKIDGDRLFAVCMESGRNKSFIISKMELPTDQDKKYSEYAMISDDVLLSQVVESHQEAWMASGWHVENGKNFISLFRRYKNGKIYKRPTVGIYYEEYIYDYSDEDANGEMADYEKKSQRPWYVFGSKKPSITYKDVSKALDRLIEYSNSISAQ